MFLENIKVSNFKSFEEISVDFTRFNVLIGANASGKSNFVSIFRFLKDIVDSGLDNAISLQGGIDYVRNTNLSTSQSLSIELHINAEDAPGFDIEETDTQVIRISPREFFYRFSINFNGKKRGYNVFEEILGIGIELLNSGEKNGKIETETLEKGKLVFIREGREIKYEIDGNIRGYLRDSTFFYLVKEFLGDKSSGKKLLLESEIPLFPIPVDYYLRNFIRHIALYDFDPQLSKSATQITGKTELEPNGSNLTLVLKNILEDKEEKEKFFDIIKSILPFVESIAVEKLIDKSMITSLRESYSKVFLPAFLISDGTISIAALIIALYFEEKPLLIFEEPGRNIHPYLISRVIEMMKDVSEEVKKRQIIITTHNPEVVKYADTDHLLLVYRDDNGFSQISRLFEKENVKIFLENMGIEELYVQNLLEW